MKAFLKGIGSLLLLAAVVAGIPAALIFLAGNPFPTGEEFARFLSGPDYGGEFLIGTLLPLIAWVAWATFAVGAVVEAIAQIRGIPAPRVPGLGVQQKWAGALIGAVLVMFTGFGAIAGPAPAAHALELHDQRAGAAVSQSIEAAKIHAAAEVAKETPAAETAPAAPTFSQRTIVPGDTLWDIAEQELGDGTRYPEIFEASKHIQQPDGRYLTDPNWIYPGWQVNVPVAAPAPASLPDPQPVPQAPVDTTADVVDDGAGAAGGEQAGGAGAGADGAGGATGGAEGAGGASDLSGIGIGGDGQAPAAETSTGTEAPAQAAASTVDADDVDEAWTEDVFVRTAGGIGGILAAGILSILGIRRLKQRRRRKPGQRISMPSEDLTPMELELRAVENPMGMDDVDHALRYLAVWAQNHDTTLPPIYAIRLSSTEISLYIDEAMDLPAPFVPVADDKTAWIIDPAELPALERIPSAPYPALVTLGQDQTDAHILIDLEHLGALNLTGSGIHTEAALTALAVELATSRWSEDLQVTLVGVAPGLPRALETGRVRHVDDIDTLLRNLRGQAEATQRALAEIGVGSIEEARSLNTEAEGWAPEIVILGELPSPEAQAELAELVTRLPRVGIASVSAGFLVGEWTLELGDDKTAVLQPLGLPLTPQLVDEQEYRQILDLLKVTDSEAVEPVSPIAAEISLEDLPPVAPVIAPVSPVEAVEADVDPDEWKRELQRLLPPGTVSLRARVVEAEQREAEQRDLEHQVLEQPAADVDDVSTEPAEVLPFHQAPYVRLLGTVTLFGARGEEPRTPHTTSTNRSVVARATELVAFLALHRGANAVEVHNALWPAADPSGTKAQQNRNALTSRARRWLGNNDGGEPYLPPVGTEGYRLHSDVRTDWDVWEELVGDDVASTSTENLVAALKLVQGQPFSGVKEKYYGWAERIRQEMIAAIGDAAHELATRSLRGGDIANARLAAAIGRQVDPVNETLWRDALRAEHQAGDPRGVDRIVTQLETYLESFEDGYEPEPETQELIEQIRLAHAS